MRDKFPWYFVETSHFDEVWTSGILTVDANVMLDLYRYNSATREALLQAFEIFKGRLWISHQTSLEFVRNRSAVIVDVSSEFDKSIKYLNEMDASAKNSISSIVGLRAIPKSLGDELGETISKAIEKALDSIERERNVTPNYNESDEVVIRLDVPSRMITSTPGALRFSWQDRF